MGPAHRAGRVGEVTVPEGRLILPNLFIPGAAKSGTSTLHDYLSRHPDIDMSVTKEPNYFWRPDKRLEHYANIFAHPERRYRGESSTNYMVRPDVVTRIRETVSDPRFIFIFRNPVDRAWSHYWWVKGEYGQESRGFRGAFQNDFDHPPQFSGYLPNTAGGYYHWGCYASWLGRYLDAFGAKRVLVLVFEDFVKEPARQLDTVYDFLGVRRIEHVDTIRSNTGRLMRVPKIMWLYARATRAVGAAVHDVLPGVMYSRLVRLNQRFTGMLHTAMACKQSNKLTDSDRVWVASYYEGEVARLREMTGLAFAEWDGDFPRHANTTGVESPAPTGGSRSATS